MPLTSLTKADVEAVVNKLFDKLEAQAPAILLPAEENLRAKAIKLVDDVAADLGIVS